MTRPGSGYGRLRSNTASTTLKMVVVAPIPTATIRIADSAKVGFLAELRAAYLRSCNNVVNIPKGSLKRRGGRLPRGTADDRRAASPRSCQRSLAAQKTR